MWKQVLLYGALLAAGTWALQALEYRLLARTHTGELYIFWVAAGFLALGVAVGVRLVSRSSDKHPGDGNPQAQASLGISARELTVLHELAAGYSNKEIAEHLNVSPHTVKTHITHLFEKLGARRRTEAIRKARDLGLVP